MMCVISAPKPLATGRRRQLYQQLTINHPPVGNSNECIALFVYKKRSRWQLLFYAGENSRI
jgi:hypothetical protein